MHTNTSKPEWLKIFLTTVGKQSEIKPSDLQAARNLHLLQGLELPDAGSDPEARRLALVYIESRRHLFILQQVEALSKFIPKNDEFQLLKQCTDLANFHRKEASPDPNLKGRIGTVNTAHLEALSSRAYKLVESNRHAFNVASRKSARDLDACAANLARAELVHEIIAALYWMSHRNNANPTAVEKFLAAVRKAHIANALVEAYSRTNNVRQARIEAEAGRQCDAAMLQGLADFLLQPFPTPAGKESIAA